MNIMFFFTLVHGNSNTQTGYDQTKAKTQQKTYKSVSHLHSP